MKVRADADKLRETAWRLEMEAGQLHDNMENIETAVLMTQGEWQGRSQEAYTAKLFQLEGEYEKLIALLQDFAAVLREAGDAYEAEDRTQAGKIEMV